MSSRLFPVVANAHGGLTDAVMQSGDRYRSRPAATLPQQRQPDFLRVAPTVHFAVVR